MAKWEQLQSEAAAKKVPGRSEEEWSKLQAQLKDMTAQNQELKHEILALQGSKNRLLAASKLLHDAHQELAAAMADFGIVYGTGKQEVQE